MLIEGAGQSWVPRIIFRCGRSIVSFLLSTAEGKPVEVRVWSVNFWMNSSCSPEPASSIHCLNLTSCHCIAFSSKHLMPFSNCTMSVVGVIRMSKVSSNLRRGFQSGSRVMVWSTYLSGTTLVWTPPLMMVRLTVVTSPSVLLGSACNFAFSWALCSKKALQMTLTSCTFIPVGQQFVDHILSLLSSSVF